VSRYTACVGITKPTHAMNTSPNDTPIPPEKLAFSKSELAAAIGLSGVTLWRLEKRGLLKPVPGIRHKLFARAEVERFLRGGK
jgi:hypothetical protein